MGKSALTASLVLMLIFGCSIAIVSASTYQLELNQVGNKIVEKHIIDMGSQKTISINLNKDASLISSKTNYSLEDNVIALSGKELEFSYVTDSDLESADDGYFFIKTVRFYSDFDSSVIRLVLDEGYFTDSERLFPKPSDIITDGHQITLIWNFQNVKEEDNIPIFVKIVSPAPSKFVLFSFWAVVFILAAAAVYLIFFRKKKHRETISKRKMKSRRAETAKFEDIERYLVESEQIVLKKLREADRGELWQKQLQLSTGFSKAKLSRVIRNLESRNLIEKIPFGNTNKVRLK